MVKPCATQMSMVKKRGHPEFSFQILISLNSAPFMVAREWHEVSSSVVSFKGQLVSIYWLGQICSALANLKIDKCSDVI